MRAMKTAPERTGWRDQGISEHHRLWGVGALAVDVDFVLLEYSWNGPAALIEYKNERAREVNYSNGSYRALAVLASGGCTPFFETRYTSDFTSFEVTPLNGIAKMYWLEDGPVTMTEKEYVTFLYLLRAQPLPTELVWNGSSLQSVE